MIPKPQISRLLVGNKDMTPTSAAPARRETYSASFAEITARCGVHGRASSKHRASYIVEGPTSTSLWDARGGNNIVGGQVSQEFTG